jgi:DHA2 family multidrug resistance protein-like MFS transporter
MQATARLVGQTAGGVAVSVLFTLAPADAAASVSLGLAAVLTLAAALASVARQQE